MTSSTLPAAEHAHRGGSAGGPGENSAECACGTVFDGFDTHREAVDLLDHHVEQENGREKKRADQLAPGDIAVDILDSTDPWISHRDGKVLASYPYVDEVDNPRVLLVVQGDGPKPKPETVRLDAEVMVGLRSEAEINAMRELAERAARIADIRAFANWLEANPGVPMPWQVQADEHLSIGDGTEIERLVKVRQVAAMLGVEVDERLADRTELEFEIGGFVKYSLVAWHKGGRPAEPITCNWCADPASPDPALHPGNGRTHVPADDLGFGFSREDDDPQVIRPHSPRVPLHTGAVVDGGQLVDETPAEVLALTPAGLTLAADESRGPLAGTTPVVTYFSFGYGQTDPDSGQKLIDHYVTVVAPTYDECRTAMFASRFGNRWSFDYLAGRDSTTEAVSVWTEHEVIVAEGLDSAVAEAALKAAAALLVSETR
jgi:hypothetical protein